MSIKDSIKYKIKEERLKLGLNQEEFGKKLNVSKQAVSGWENGYRTPDIETLNELSKIFNCTSDYLLGRTDNPNNDVVEVTHNGEEYIFEFKTGKKKVDKDEIQEIINKYESMQDFINDFTKK